MSLVIDLTPEVEDRLQQEASRQGLDKTEYAKRLIEANLSTPLTEKQKATIALLQSWIDEDTTNDPEELAEREAEWKEFKQSMNENRAREEPIFP